MVKLDVLYIFYIDGGFVNKSTRASVNVVHPFGDGIMLDDRIRRPFELGLILSDKELINYSTKLYIADSTHPDQYYADADDLENIDLGSTGEEIIQQFNRKFPESENPLAVVKLFYMTDEYLGCCIL